MFRILFLVSLSFIAACTSPPTTPISTPAEPETIQFQLDEIAIQVLRPPGWNDFQEESSLLLVEQSSDADDQLAGIAMHIWASEVEDDVSATTAALERILRQFVSRAEAATSQPAAFTWDGHDAAYYLLNSGDGHITLVIGIHLPEHDRLLAVNISAPADQSNRLRLMLPQLFNGFTIDGKKVSTDGLSALPQALVMPHFTPGQESASQPTPSS